MDVGARRRTGIALVAVALLAGCSPEETETALINGSLTQVGGPAPGSAVPLSGKVAFTSDDRTVTVNVREDGRFTAHLPPGFWSVRGFAPNAQGALVPCSAPPEQVLLVGGQVTQHDVVCRQIR
jgi:hypothetical protein